MANLRKLASGKRTCRPGPFRVWSTLAAWFRPWRGRRRRAWPTALRTALLLPKQTPGTVLGVSPVGAAPSAWDRLAVLGVDATQSCHGPSLHTPEFPKAASLVHRRGSTRFIGILPISLCTLLWRLLGSPSKLNACTHAHSMAPGSLSRQGQ